MKKLFMLAILGALALSGCAPREPANIAAEFITADGETLWLATNEAVDFYFYYPENFIMDKNAAMISIFISDHELIENELGPEIYQSLYINPNLSVTVFTLRGGHANAEQYWSEYVLPSLNEVFSDLFIESSEDIEIAGIVGRKYVYTMSLSGQEYRQAQVIFFRNNEVYHLTYTATPARFDRHSRVLDIVVETFAFR